MNRRFAVLAFALLALALAAAVALARQDGGSPEAAAPAPVVRGEGPLALAGALELSPSGREAHADVAAYGNLAFVGKAGGACPAAGVDVVDVSDPAAPRKVGETDHHENTSMEDVDALRVGDRDVLAVGLQRCRGDAPGGRIGLELYDVTDPARPRRLAFFDVAAYSRDVGGVHELDVTATPSGRALALLAVPNLERRTAGPEGRGGTGDLLMVDITDPERPSLLAEWGLMDEPSLGPGALQTEARGAQGAVFLHSARAGADGTVAYLSYWDAGVIILDISDPAAPRYLGRTAYGPEDEGNAHSVAEGDGGRLLVQADEDFSPRRLTVTADALPGPRPAQPASFGPDLGDGLAGETVFVGRGCPGDAYQADPAGRIALIERGECPFNVKVALAQEAGATAVVVYNNVSEEGAMAMGGEDTAALPGGREVTVTIPSLAVDRETGLRLREAAPAALAAAPRFDGWGFLRFWDVRDPARPVPLGTYATPAAADPALVGQGTWSVHNPEVRGTVVYASWYSDGVRAIDVSDPGRPREVAAWTGQGAPPGAGPVDIWG
ncbi:MAG TPA: PA domain-containing protein, partial [Dehalococcoidia bacterium]